MIGRKSVLSLSLLSVLAFCAFGAQSASAAWQTATHTTAFTCVKGGGGLDFKDPHCKEGVTPGTGEYGHVAIKAGETTPIKITNETTPGQAATPAVLTGSLFGATVKITCNTVANNPAKESWQTNLETKTAGEVIDHDVHGTSGINFSGCKVEGNGATCKVKEPVATTTFVNAEEEPTTGNMALNFTPDPAGSAYAVIEFEGGCLVFKTEVKGSARGTVEGATINFKPEDESLTAFGNAATFTGKFTVSNATSGTPLSTTTVT